MRSIEGRMGASGSGKAGVRERGCFDRREALTRRFLCFYPTDRKTLCTIWRGGREELGARNGPRAGWESRYRTVRRKRVHTCAW